jgi:hypothetical protein
MKENIIKKITIEIGETEVEVTPKQALALYEALADLLNKSPKVVEKHVHHDQYIRWPYYGTTWTGPGIGPYTVRYSGKTQAVNLSLNGVQ